MSLVPEIWQHLPIELTGLIIEWRCIMNIRQHFREYKCECILDELHVNNSKMAGSFVLQCALDETYSNSDIDIFTPFTRLDRKGTASYAVQPLEEFMHTQICNCEPPTNCCWHEGDGSMPDHPYIFATRKFRIEQDRNKEDFMTNVITISGISVLKFINKRFDADICKICYDGQTLQYDGHPLHTRPDIVRKLLNKTITFTLQWPNAGKKLREIYNEILEYAQYHHCPYMFHFKHSCERISKYTNRNYNVLVMLNQHKDYKP
jgi:hypothetical protein